MILSFVTVRTRKRKKKMKKNRVITQNDWEKSWWHFAWDMTTVFQLKYVWPMIKEWMFSASFLVNRKWIGESISQSLLYIIQLGLIWFFICDFFSSFLADSTHTHTHKSSFICRWIEKKHCFQTKHNKQWNNNKKIVPRF